MPLATPQKPTDSLLEVLQERQESILSRLPNFAKVTIPIATLGFALTFVIKLFADTSFRAQVSNMLLSQPTPGSIIALVLSIVANLIIWVFVVWSLSFVPFIAFYAYKASRKGVASVVTKPFRWVQLCASTFLPMAIFATAWISFANEGKSNVVVQITSVGDVIFVVFGTAFVVAILIAKNKWIPVRLAAVRLSLFSSLLYLSLFLAYGRGVGLASHSMVFGILIYIMFGSSQLAELARRITILDIDHEIAKRFDDLLNRHQELRSKQDNTYLMQKEHEAQSSQHQLDLTISRAGSDMDLEQQLAGIRKKKLSLNQKMNEVQLQIFEKKIQTLTDGFDILSSEFSERMGREIPQKLRDLKENVKTYSPQEIHTRLSLIMTEMNTSLEGIPESLEELRAKLLQTASELERQTRLLLEGSKESHDNFEI